VPPRGGSKDRCWQRWTSLWNVSLTTCTALFTKQIILNSITVFMTSAGSLQLECNLHHFIWTSERLEYHFNRWSLLESSSKLHAWHAKMTRAQPTTNNDKVCASAVNTTERKLHGRPRVTASSERLEIGKSEVWFLYSYDPITRGLIIKSFVSE
jgi:hypothetical protein